MKDLSHLSQSVARGSDEYQKGVTKIFLSLFE